jgi:hypothetical protein
MKHLQVLMVLAFCAGCTSGGQEFVQGAIRIATPVTWETNKIARFWDGGTLLIPIRDAAGKEFDVYFDHRLESPTPGAIYLNGHPGESHSIRVLDAVGFRRKVGDYGQPR